MNESLEVDGILGMETIEAMSRHGMTKMWSLKQVEEHLSK